jgi:perosamine synthetase
MIPLFKPSFGDEELEALREPFKSGWIGLGPKTKEFEDKFATYVGAEFGVGTNSATAALHLGLKALGVEGGEVITTSLTFVSTNHAILYNKAVPVFADVESDTLNIDATEVERLINPKTRAIMLVHYGGHPCDLDAIRGMAQKHRLPVLEDAAHACGAEYKGQRIGSISEVTAFSFHAVKNLSTGEGGMITFSNSEFNGRLRQLRWMGINKDTWSRAKFGDKYSWSYGVEELGYKEHMSDIAAAIGLVQLSKLEKMNARRRQIVEMYNAAFSPLGWLETPVERSYAKSANHAYVVKLDKRDSLIAFLAEKGIATGVHYIPNHCYGIYQPYYRHLPITENVWKRIVTLPLFPDLQEEQVEYIIDSVRQFGATRM